MTGGYVYRGKAVPRSRAVTSTATTAAGTSGPCPRPVGRLGSSPIRVPGLSSFGESLAGELYAVSHEGAIYRLAR